MAKQSQRRILRNYRNLNPSKFHAYNQRIRNGLTNNPKIPESTWTANPTLMSSYSAASDKHDATYHQALYGSRLDIAERGVLQAQIVDYLDEIASILEAVAVRSSDVLLSSGFDLAKERRGQPRTKPTPAASEDFKVFDAGQPHSG